MALSDLAVYSEFAYSAMTEVLSQQTELFNQATEGALLLSPASVQGDFNEQAYFAAISGLGRRRNAYGSGSVAEKQMAHLKDTEVKVAAGTPPVRIDPSMFAWIQQSPEVAGVALRQQIAKAAMGDMLNAALGCGVAALAGSDNVFDATATSNKVASWLNLNLGQAKLGDQSGDIVAWVMHSAPMHALYGNNLTNAEGLFNYGSVNVVRDPFGKLLVMTDAAPLVTAGTPSVYSILGLVPGGLRVGQNGDFFANEETKNGAENIVRTYQAEWSYNVGVKGFSWDKGTGGASPTDAALFTSANWDKISTSNKDLAGVLVKVN